MSDNGAVPAIHQVSSHDRILLSAKRLFARNGYENTSTVAIAREAGTSESQLMKHFGSKQGLLLAIFERGWAGMSGRMRVAQNSRLAADKLLAVLETIVIELENDHELKTLMVLESRRVRKENRDVLLSHGYQQVSAVVDEILKEMREQGDIGARVNLEAVRAACMGMTEGLLRDQVMAERSNLPAGYSFDDVRKVLALMVPAFREREQSVKAASE